VEQGKIRATVARRAGVVPQTVARCVSQYRCEGRSDLKRTGRAGRKSILDQLNREGLDALLREGPKQLGYETCPSTKLNPRASLAVLNR
jgi:transposase